MAQVRWTPQAADDLEAICLFNPRLGRVVPELGIDTFREIIAGSYRVIYRIKQEDVHVLTLHHGARLFDSARIEGET